MSATIGDILATVGIDPSDIDGICEIDYRSLQTNSTSASISFPSAGDYGLLETDKKVSVVVFETDEEYVMVSQISK